MVSVKYHEGLKLKKKYTNKVKNEKKKIKNIYK